MKFFIIFCLAIVSSNSFAERKSCSGKKGGVVGCSNGKYICKDGSTSQSKKKCK